MQRITLYRYERPDGGIDVSPKMPENTEYTTLFRLVADEEKILTDGEIFTPCIDTNSDEGWTEVDDESEALND